MIINTKKKIYFSGNLNDTSYLSNRSSVNNNEDNEQTEHTNVCCILDCVNCLMILHRNEFIDDNNHQQMKEIQDSCTSCLIKILKFYKVPNNLFINIYDYLICLKYR